ncbi:MFS general substrate transporter [Hypoxylon sp. NC1633]|nr:MFS general substrate transporter [Hypoxylon sp. NC1633]
MSSDIEKSSAVSVDNRSPLGHAEKFEVVPIDQEALEIVAAQGFVVVVAANSVIAIIRDLGDGLLLIQSVLSPIVGCLSDVLHRNMLIGGGILIGVTLATISIVQAIRSEILPLKLRALAQGLNGIGSFGAGAVTNVNAGGWRYIFWMQAAFHNITLVRLFCFHWPPKHVEYPRMLLRYYIWVCDPIGSTLSVGSATLLLLALDWAGGAYAWSSPHVSVPLALGLVLLVSFALHVFAFVIRAVYSTAPLIRPCRISFLNLAFESNLWRISVRQLSHQLPSFLASVPIVWYSTRYKDLKFPLLVTFTVFLILGFNVLTGIGQAGPLALLIACIQFTAPHAILSTTTGLAFSTKAISKAFVSAVLNAIINGRPSSHYAASVGEAALSTGLPENSVAALLEALDAGQIGSGVDAATLAVWAAAVDPSKWEHAYAYQLAGSSVIPFVALAIVAVVPLKGVKELMTDQIGATIEQVRTGV